MANFFKKKEEQVIPADAVDYKVEVITSDIKGAGTNAKVFLILYGESTDSGKVILPSKKEHFEKGKIDLFEIKAKDVGTIKKIRIGHDNSGFGAAWHCKQVHIFRGTAKYIFPCNRWFDKSQEDGAIERDLFPEASSSTVAPKTSSFVSTPTTTAPKSTLVIGENRGLPPTPPTKPSTISGITTPNTYGSPIPPPVKTTAPVTTTTTTSGITTPPVVPVKTTTTPTTTTTTTTPVVPAKTTSTVTTPTTTSGINTPPVVPAKTTSTISTPPVTPVKTTPTTPVAPKQPVNNPPTPVSDPKPVQPLKPSTKPAVSATEKLVASHGPIEDPIVADLEKEFLEFHDKWISTFQSDPQQLPVNDFYALQRKVSKEFRKLSWTVSTPVCTAVMNMTNWFDTQNTYHSLLNKKARLVFLRFVHEKRFSKWLSENQGLGTRITEYSVNQLVLAFNNVPLTLKLHELMRSVLDETMRQFAKNTYHTPEQLFSIAPLAAADDESLCRALFNFCLTKIRDQPLFDPILVEALSYMLRYVVSVNEVPPIPGEDPAPGDATKPDAIPPPPPNPALPAEETPKKKKGGFFSFSRQKDNAKAKTTTTTTAPNAPKVTVSGPKPTLPRLSPNATKLQRLDVDDMTRIIDILFARLQMLHGQADPKKIQSLLGCMATLLNTLVDVGVEGFDKEKTKGWWEVLKDIAGDNDQNIKVRYLARICNECVARLPDAESKIVKYLGHGMNMVSGVLKLATAAVSLDPLAMLEGIYELKDEVLDTVSDVRRDWKSGWYSKIRFVELLFQRYPPVKAMTILHNEVIESKQWGGIELPVAYGIIFMLEPHLANGSNVLGQSWAIKVLSKIVNLSFSKISQKVLGDWTTLYEHIANDCFSALTQATSTFSAVFQNSTQTLLLDLLVKLKKVTEADRATKEWTVAAFQDLVQFLNLSVKTTYYDGLNKDVLEKTSILMVNNAFVKAAPLQYRIQKMMDQMQRQINAREVKLDLQYYIPLRGASTLDELAKRQPQTFDLAGHVLDHLNLEGTRHRSTFNPKLLLIQGPSGCGKSSFGQDLHSKLFEKWQEADQDGSECEIPLFVILGQLKDPSVRCVEQTLENLGCNQEEIAGMKKNFRFVLFLDGYDEIKTFKNLYASNELHEWKAHVIITCRLGYLSTLGDYNALFQIMDSKGQKQNAYELYIAPFNPGQIKQYLLKNEDNLRAALVSDEKLSDRKSFRFNAESDKKKESKEDLADKLLAEFVSYDMGELIKEPFILKILVQVWPSFKRQERSGLVKKNKTAIYKIFLDQWYDREEDKLRENVEMSSLLPKDFKIKSSFQEFAEDLAFEMFCRNAVLVPVASNQYRKYAYESLDPWARFFDLKKPEVRIARYGVPLKTTGNVASFLHKSIMEYFIASVLYDDITFSPVIPWSDKSFFNMQRIDQEYSVMTFLKEMIDGDEDRIEALFAMVQKSRQTASVARMSANAISLLANMKVGMSGRDFSRCEIPQANLSGAMLDHANFEHSNMSECMLRNAWLHGANLDQTNLEKVNFGEDPFLSHPQKVNECRFSDDGKYVMTKTRNLFYIWDIAKSEVIQTWAIPQDAFEEISLKGELIGIEPDNKNYLVWRFTSGADPIEVPDSKGINERKFFSDGRYAVWGRSDGGALAWDFENQQRIEIAPASAGRVNAIGVMEKTDQVVISWAPTKAVATVPQLVVVYDLTGTVVPIEFKVTNLKYKADYLWPTKDGKYVVALHNKSFEIFTVNPYSVKNIKTENDLDSDVFFNNNNTWVFLSSENFVHIVELATGNMKTVENPETTCPKACWPTPDTCIFANEGSNHLLVWETSQSKPTKTLKGHQNRVTELIPSLDGKVLYSCSRSEKTILAWDIDSESCIKVFTGHTEQINKVDMNADGTMLVSAGDDNTVRLWPLNTKDKIAGSMKQFKTVLATEVDKNRLVRIFKDCSVSCTDIKTGRELWKDSGAAFPYQDILISEDHEWLAALDKSNVQIWRRKPKKMGFVFQGTLTGHAERISYGDFSGNSKFFVTTCDSPEAVVKVWSLDTCKCIKTIERTLNYVYGVKCNYDCKYVLTTERTNDEGFYVYSVDTGKVIRQYKTDDSFTFDVCPNYYTTETVISDWSGKMVHKFDAKIQAAKFINHNRWALVFCEKAAAHLVDLTHSPPKVSQSFIFNVPKRVAVVHALSQDLKWIAIAQGQKISVFEYDAGDNEVKSSATLSGHNYDVVACNFPTKEKSQFLITVDSSGSVKYWEFIPAESDWRLNWSDEVLLNLQGASIEACMNVSKKNRQLLEQRGAVGTPELVRDDYPDFEDIHWAVLTNNEDKVKELLDEDESNLEKRTENSQSTPLHVAARYGHRSMAEFLLDRGADYEAKDDTGRCPGQVALDFQKTNVLRVLPWLDREKPDFDFLMTAVKDSKEEVVKRIIADMKKGKKIYTATGPKQAIHVARDMDVLKLLVEELNVDINAQDDELKTLLWIACEKSKEDIVKYLISLDAKPLPDKERQNVVIAAIKGKNNNILKAILEKYKIDLTEENEYDETPLIAAVMERDLDVIETLIKAGADPNHYTSSDRQAFRESVNMNYMDVLQLLLTHGADVKAVNKKGESILTEATSSSVEMFKLLIGKGATIPNDMLCHVDDIAVAKYLVEIKPDLVKYENLTTGSTPLHEAASLRSATMIPFLLSFNPDVNKAEKKTGDTPLHKFVSWEVTPGEAKVCQLLLDKGANPAIPNLKGQTPLSIAEKEKGNTADFIAALKKACKPVPNAPKVVIPPVAPKKTTAPPPATNPDDDLDKLLKDLNIDIEPDPDLDALLASLQ